mgnify:FL=1
MEFSKKINHRYTILCISIIFIILICLYLNSYDDYFDDWNFFYTVDSNISNQETWQRHYHGDKGDYIMREGFPWVFAYFTKYLLKFIGYSVENTHYFLLSFSIISVFVFYKLSDFLSKDLNFKIIVLILFSLNLFLIRELNSFRPHSPTLFFSLVSSYYYIKIFIRNSVSKKNYFIYFLSTFLMLTLWPQSLAFFAGQIVFAIIFFSNFKRILVLPAIFISYVLLNIDYIFYLTVDFEWGYTPFEKKFFLNYFFRSFFGSILFGGFMLVLFACFFIKKLFSLNLKLNFNLFKKNELTPINYFLTIILTIYSLAIMYSLLKTSVMAPKYFIPLVPIIILWIGYNVYLTKNNFLLFGTIFLAIINCVYFLNDIQIDRPPNKKVLKIISDSKFREVYTPEGAAFNHYLNHYNIALNKNINFKKEADLVKLLNYDKTELRSLPNKFWFLCLNNPRFTIGENNFPDDEECLVFHENENFKLIKTIRLPDYLLYMVKKN